MLVLMTIMPGVYVYKPEYANLLIALNVDCIHLINIALQLYTKYCIGYLIVL